MAAANTCLTAVLGGNMPGTAYLPGYAHDIFVSYAHEETLGEWTAKLQDELRKALNLIFYLKPPGPVFNIWIDEALRNNLPLTESLKERVENSALLLIVMSPHYLNSAWCGREVSWFSEVARSRIKSDARIFVIHAAATERRNWPAPLLELPGYRFHARHPQANVELPLGLIGDEPDKVAFKQALYNLAGQIKQQVDELVREATAPPPPPERPITLVHRSEPRQASAALVCLDTLGSGPPDRAKAAEREIRRMLAARDVEIFAAEIFETVPRDPLLANRLMQKLIKAKAGCDGLIALRLDPAAPAEEWLLEYLSEIRPMAPQVRIDGSVPRPLIVELSPSVADLAGIPSLSYADPQFEARLGAWIDSLPSARRIAA
jgi:hypothetical protein